MFGPVGGIDYFCDEEKLFKLYRQLKMTNTMGQVRRPLSCGKRRNFGISERGYRWVCVLNWGIGQAQAKKSGPNSAFGVFPDPFPGTPSVLRLHTAWHGSRFGGAGDLLSQTVGYYDVVVKYVPSRGHGCCRRWPYFGTGCSHGRQRGDQDHVNSSSTCGAVGRMSAR